MAVSWRRLKHSSTWLMQSKAKQNVRQPAGCAATHQSWNSSGLAVNEA